MAGARRSIMSMLAGALESLTLNAPEEEESFLSCSDLNQSHVDSTYNSLNVDTTVNVTDSDEDKENDTFSETLVINSEKLLSPHILRDNINTESPILIPSKVKSNDESAQGGPFNKRQSPLHENVTQRPKQEASIAPSTPNGLAQNLSIIHKEKESQIQSESPLVDLTKFLAEETSDASDIKPPSTIEGPIPDQIQISESYNMRAVTEVNSSAMTKVTVEEKIAFVDQLDFSSTSSRIPAVIVEETMGFVDLTNVPLRGRQSLDAKVALTTQDNTKIESTVLVPSDFEFKDDSAQGGQHEEQQPPLHEHVVKCLEQEASNSPSTSNRLEQNLSLIHKENESQNQSESPLVDFTKSLAKETLDALDIKPSVTVKGAIRNGRESLIFVSSTPDQIQIGESDNVTSVTEVNSSAMFDVTAEENIASVDQLDFSSSSDPVPAVIVEETVGFIDLTNDSVQGPQSLDTMFALTTLDNINTESAVLVPSNFEFKDESAQGGLHEKQQSPLHEHVVKCLEQEPSNSPSTPNGLEQKLSLIHKEKQSQIQQASPLVELAKFLAEATPDASNIKPSVTVEGAIRNDRESVIFVSSTLEEIQIAESDNMRAVTVVNSSALPDITVEQNIASVHQLDVSASPISAVIVEETMGFVDLTDISVQGPQSLDATVTLTTQDNINKESDVLVPSNVEFGDELAQDGQHEKQQSPLHDNVEQEAPNSPSTAKGLEKNLSLIDKEKESQLQFNLTTSLAEETFDASDIKPSVTGEGAIRNDGESVISISSTRDRIHIAESDNMRAVTEVNSSALPDVSVEENIASVHQLDVSASSDPIPAVIVEETMGFVDLTDISVQGPQSLDTRVTLTTQDNINTETTVLVPSNVEFNDELAQGSQHDKPQSPLHDNVTKHSEQEASHASSTSNELEQNLSLIHKENESESSLVDLTKPLAEETFDDSDIRPSITVEGAIKNDRESVIFLSSTPDLIQIAESDKMTAGAEVNSAMPDITVEENIASADQIVCSSSSGPIPAVVVEATVGFVDLTDISVQGPQSLDTMVTVTTHVNINKESTVFVPSNVEFSDERAQDGEHEKQQSPLHEHATKWTEDVASNSPSSAKGLDQNLIHKEKESQLLQDLTKSLAEETSDTPDIKPSITVEGMIRNDRESVIFVFPTPERIQVAESDPEVNSSTMPDITAEDVASVEQQDFSSSSDPVPSVVVEETEDLTNIYEQGPQSLDTTVTPTTHNYKTNMESGISVPSNVNVCDDEFAQVRENIENVASEQPSLSLTPRSTMRLSTGEDYEIVSHTSVIEASPSVVEEKYNKFKKASHLKLKINSLQQTIGRLNLQNSQKEGIILQYQAALDKKFPSCDDAKLLHLNKKLLDYEETIQKKQGKIDYLLSEVERLENEVKSLKDDAAKEKEAMQPKLEATVVQLKHAFAVLHEKYTKSRSIINGLMHNEDIYKEHILELEMSIKNYQENYQRFKKMAVDKIELANQENKRLMESNAQKVARIVELERSLQKLKGNKKSKF